MTINLSWFFHFVSYYIAWIACVYYAAHDAPYKGPLITFAVMLFQTGWELVHKHSCLRPWAFALGLTLAAFFVDTFWLHTGMLYFNANPFGAQISAPWILCLWLSFGFYIVVTTEQLMHYYLAWGLLTLISLPFAYWLGVRVGAAIVTKPWLFYPVHGLIWAFLLPACLYVYNALRPKKNPELFSYTQDH